MYGYLSLSIHMLPML